MRIIVGGSVISVESTNPATMSRESSELTAEEKANKKKKIAKGIITGLGIAGAAAAGAGAAYALKNPENRQKLNAKVNSVYDRFRKHDDSNGSKNHMPDEVYSHMEHDPVEKHKTSPDEVKNAPPPSELSSHMQKAAEAALPAGGLSEAQKQKLMKEFAAADAQAAAAAKRKTRLKALLAGAGVALAAGAGAAYAVGSKANKNADAAGKNHMPDEVYSHMEHDPVEKHKTSPDEVKNAPPPSELSSHMQKAAESYYERNYYKYR